MHLYAECLAVLNDETPIDW